MRPGMGRIGSAWMAALLWLTADVPATQEPRTAGTVTLEGPIAHAIDDYLTRCVPFAFSGSVLVVLDGSVILSKGYGIADRATGTPCTPATIYDLGQLAQPLTACAVLVLEQQKKLRTKDTLEQFLPDVPTDKRKIQLLHLLTHTSGLPPTIPGVAAKTETREDLIRMSLRMTLRDPPGTHTTTSDAGYTLLAAVVEIVTKQSFEEALRELVLRPA